jgi:hypothetical protein
MPNDVLVVSFLIFVFQVWIDQFMRWRTDWMPFSVSMTQLWLVLKSIIFSCTFLISNVAKSNRLLTWFFARISQEFAATLVSSSMSIFDLVTKFIRTYLTSLDRFQTIRNPTNDYIPTRLENLSNELWLDVMDYLDVRHIYKAFLDSTNESMTFYVPLIVFLLLSAELKMSTV